MKALSKRIVSFIITLVLIVSLVPVRAEAAELGYDSFYGRSALSAMSRGSTYVTAYDRIYDCVENRAASTNLSDLKPTKNEFLMVLSAYECDPQSQFWCDWNFDYYDNGSYVTSAVPNYNALGKLSGAELSKTVKQVESKANNIIYSAGIKDGMSDYEKAVRIHDVLALRIEYTFTENCRNIYGALVEGQAVCQGYALSYQYLLRLVGVQAFIVTGSAGGEAHGWNIVSLDGRYCHIDLTWDDPTGQKLGNATDVYHNYFGMTTNQIRADHSITVPAYGLPDCQSSDLYYFNRYTESVMDSKSSAEKIASVFDRNGVGKMYINASDLDHVLSVITSQGAYIAEDLGFDLTKPLSISYSQVGNEYRFMFVGEKLPSAVKEGDLDGDGKVSAIDSNILRRIVSGQIQATDDQMLAGDIDGDTKITGMDSNILKRRIAGN